MTRLYNISPFLGVSFCRRRPHWKSQGSRIVAPPNNNIGHDRPRQKSWPRTTCARGNELRRNVDKLSDLEDGQGGWKERERGNLARSGQKSRTTKTSIYIHLIYIRHTLSPFVSSPLRVVVIGMNPGHQEGKVQHRGARDLGSKTRTRPRFS